MKDGAITLDVSGQGITAIAIEGVDVKPSFQDRVGKSADKWTVNYTSAGFYKDRAVLFDFGPGLKSIYVWNESDNNAFASTTLHYALDGNWETLSKKGYPYEFTIPISDETGCFEYYFEATTPSGTTLLSEKASLRK